MDLMTPQIRRTLRMSPDFHGRIYSESIACSFSRKFAITAICAIATVVCTLASSAPSAAVLAFIEEFHVSQEVANLTTSVFLRKHPSFFFVYLNPNSNSSAVGYVAGPLIWAPGSELIGRRPIFLWSILALVLVQIGGALAKNMATLLVFRFLSGVFSASPITNSGGVIADVWDAIGRGPAMAIVSVYYLSEDF
jgi:MFS transporter, DHA1 family, multidrug resistance protein